jgi:hypothetical protein
MQGRHEAQLTDADTRAHQRLLREFLCHHLHDGRSLRAFDVWESGGLRSTEPSTVGTLGSLEQQ